jgi:hypothetical protein
VTDCAQLWVMIGVVAICSGCSLALSEALLPMDAAGLCAVQE